MERPTFNLIGKIPKLKGESNLDHYITRSVPPPNNDKDSFHSDEGDSHQEGEPEEEEREASTPREPSPSPPPPSPSPPPSLETRRPKAMDRPFFDLIGKIPKLKGESNFEEWKSLVRGITYTHNLDRYIDGSVPPPSDDVNSLEYTIWKYERGSLTVMLLSSVIEIRDKLRTAGLAVEEMDPHAIYTKVCQTIPQDSEDFIGDLMWRFMERRREDFDSLEAFQREHQYLRRRMRELDVCPQDKFMIFCTLKKLEDTIPKAFPFLEREFEAKNLTWDGLMKAITREKSREKAPALAAAAPTQQGRNGPGTNDLTSNPKWEAVFRTLQKKGVDDEVVRSLSWCHKCQGFMWKGYSHHSTTLRNGCGNCHPYGECPHRIKYEEGPGRNGSRIYNPDVFGDGTNSKGGQAP